MGRCLEAVGVQPYRTVDTYGRETFHPWSLDYTLFSNRRTKYELHSKVAVSAACLVWFGLVWFCRVVSSSLTPPTSRSLHPTTQTRTDTYACVHITHVNARTNTHA